MMLRMEYIAQPMYPELNRVMIIVRMPVLGPRVAMKDVRPVAIAPKHRIVAVACLFDRKRINVESLRVRRNSRKCKEKYLLAKDTNG